EVVLDRGHVAARVGEGGGPLRVVGAPAVGPDLAAVHQLVQHGYQIQRLWYRQVVDVQLVQVDKVGTEPAQRGFQLPAQPRRGAVRPAGLPAGLVEGETELGRDHHLVAPAGEGPPEYPLAVPGAVHVRRVEERHAQL